MKTLLLIFVLFISLSESKAQVLHAKPLQGLMDLIEKSDFRYKERGMVFGFNTIQSCLYLSEKVAIFKNYCFPVRDYPARGYTILSSEYGIIDLYEEKMPGVLKRDITISQFPEIASPYFTIPFPEVRLQDLSDVIEDLYHQYNPGCWSTNSGYNSQAPEAGCTVDTQYVMDFEKWASETRPILLDVNEWFRLIDRIEAKLNQYPQ